MKRNILTSLIIIALVTLISMQSFADFTEDLLIADDLDVAGKYTEAKTYLFNILKDSLSTENKVEIYWRLSRECLLYGDNEEKRGTPKKQLLLIYEEGESYANKAIELAADNHLGYFWKSGNIGRWGQTKGIFEALNKAERMKELLYKAILINAVHSTSFHVLGELYEQVPGFPLSFGNVEYSVSLAKKAIDLNQEQYENGTEEEITYLYYIKYAIHLYKRRWSASTRNRKHENMKNQYYSKTDILEKNCFYEGVTTIKNMSDREEAVEVIRMVIRELESVPNRKKLQDDDLAEAKELLSMWN